MSDAWQPIETCPKTDMEKEIQVTAAIERLRELREKATAGPWFTAIDDDTHGIVDSCVLDSEDDERPVALAVEYRNAGLIVAMEHALPALLECASALEAFASDNFVSGSQMVEAVKKARAALDALAAQGEKQ